MCRRCCQLSARATGTATHTVVDKHGAKAIEAGAPAVGGGLGAALLPTAAQDKRGGRRVPLQRAEHLVVEPHLALERRGGADIAEVPAPVEVQAGELDVDDAVVVRTEERCWQGSNLGTGQRAVVGFAPDALSVEHRRRQGQQHIAAHEQVGAAKEAARGVGEAGASDQRLSCSDAHARLLKAGAAVGPGRAVDADDRPTLLQQCQHRLLEGSTTLCDEAAEVGVGGRVAPVAAFFAEALQPVDDGVIQQVVPKTGDVDRDRRCGPAHAAL